MVRQHCSWGLSIALGSTKESTADRESYGVADSIRITSGSRKDLEGLHLFEKLRSYRLTASGAGYLLALRCLRYSLSTILVELK